VKTGRLLKFHRGATEIHAYLYRDAAAYHAAVYVMPSSASGQPSERVRSLTAPTEHEVEAAAREWIESHYPRG
jgi:hypothetical protein